MAEVHSLVGESKVVLSGKEFGLRPDFLALTQIEDITGSSIIEVLQRFASGTMRLKDVGAVLYSCAKSFDQKLPYNYTEFGALVYDEGLVELTAPAFGCISRVMSGAKEKKKDEAIQ